MFAKLLGLSIIFSLALPGLGLQLETSPAGKTINVNSTADVNADDGVCTLREAVIAANSDTASGGQAGECPAGDGVDKIIIPAGIYKFPDSVTWEDAALSGDLDILEALTIEGGGIDATVINGNDQDRIFDIPDNGTIVHIHKLTIKEGAGFDKGGGGGILNNGNLTLQSVKLSTNGDPIFTDCGGGILNNGTTLISHSEIIGNPAAGGGGICNNDTLTINNSRILNNFARFGAGGISNSSGSTLNIVESTISDNIARFYGGINNSGELTIIRSTISGNLVDNFCAGIGNEDELIIENSTVSSNEAPDYGGGICIEGGIAEISYTTITKNSSKSGSTPEGGGIYASSGTIEFDNSIIAENLSPNGPDCYGPAGALVSLGHNLVGNANGCNWISATGDLIGWPNAPIDPKLGPLTDNGGPTLTHALFRGSPAIDSANQQTFPEKDQRGVVRPQGQRADRGCYEAVQLSIEDIQVSEKIAGNSEAYIKVSLSGKNARDVQVNYKTVDGTAKAGADYVSISGTLIFPVGTLSKSITVTILPDLLKEAPEEFYLELSSEIYSVVLDKTGQVTIQDASKWMLFLPLVVKENIN